MRYGRGIALCAAQDSFVKKLARKLARSRCVHALMTQKTSMDINYDAQLDKNKYPISRLFDCKEIIPPPYLFAFKSEYDANLTPYEYEIIKDEPLNEK
jgi:hypothetical protein